MLVIDAKSKAHIIAALVGGVIVFAWMVISWMVLPFNESVIHKFVDEKAVSTTLLQNAYDGSGIYALPSCNSCEAKSAQKKEKAVAPAPGMPAGDMSPASLGPVAFVSVRIGYRDVNMMNNMWQSLVYQIAAAYVISWLLMQGKGISFRRKVAFVAMAGFVGPMLGAGMDAIWWEFPPEYGLLQIVNALIAWTFAGLAMAKIVHTD